MIYLKFLSLIIGSLFVFLYFLKLLRFELENSKNNKARFLLQKYSNNLFLSFIFGILLTIFFTSSTATTAITITLLSASYISFPCAVVVILGANIGTTITPFLFSFDIYAFSFIFILLGLLFKLLKKINFIYYIGAILFSLLVLTKTLNELTSSLSYIFFDSLLLLVLEGSLLACLFNSSSTVVITTSLLYTANVINLFSAISLMLGANIGTTLTGFIYAFNQSKKVTHLVTINVLYNLISAFITLSFLDYFIKLLNLFHCNKSIVIPFSHFLFNFISTIIFYILFVFYYKLKKKNLDF